MQERVTKGIITASYNNDGKKGPIRDKVMSQIEKEKRKGYKFFNHLILRDTEKHRVTKFNFLSCGIPIIDFVMFNAAKTSLERIAVVGDEITKFNVEAFRDYFKDDRFEYVDEGSADEWSLSETLRKGNTQINANGEISLVLMGDLPFAWNLEHLLTDPDIKDNDAILDLNTRMKVGLFFPRQYHFKIKHRRGNFLAKEPNLYLMDVEKFLPIADLIYSGRKTNMNEGRRTMFERLFINDGKWLDTLRGLGKIYAAEMAFNLAAGRKPLLKPERIYDVLKETLGLKVKFKADNDQPGTLEDIDSLEDWAYLWEMLSKAEDAFYPYFSTLRKFASDVMPEFRRRFEFYSGFSDYMNSLFAEYGLSEPFVGDFQMPFTSDRIRRMMMGNILYHRKYNRKYSREVRA